MPSQPPSRSVRDPGPPPSGLGDVALMLWRERLLMLIVFLAAFALLAAGAFLLLEKTYTAHTSLLVRQDEAYAYNPMIASEAGGSALGIEQIIQSEASILRADTLKRRTLESLGLRTVYPDLANAYIEAPSNEARERVMAQAMRRVSSNLSVSVAPGSPNIEVRFRHSRAETSARFLNALVREYLAYRPDVLQAFSPEGYQEQREEYEARLAGANAALEQFLTANEIGDFESYRLSLQQRQTEVDAGLYAARADLEQSRAQLGSLRTRIAQLPAEIDQYVENDATGRLANLMIERVDLLSRYTEEAPPVVEITQRINELSAFIASGGTEGAGTRRTGPNPVRQELQGVELQLTGQAAALDRRVAELTRQRNQLQQEQIRIQGLAPQFERLNRDLTALQTTVNAIATRQEASRAQRELAAAALDNVTIVQPAMTPDRASSLRRPALAGAFIVAGILAVLTGLGRGLMRGGPRILPDWAPAPSRERPERPARAAAPRRQSAPEPEPEAFAPPPGLPVLATVPRRAASAPAPAYG